MDPKKKIQETLKRSTLKRGVSDTDDYLLDCLGSLSHKSRIREYYTSFVPGTREWVFDSFQEWLSPPSKKKRASLESGPSQTNKKKKVFVFAAEAGMGKTAVSAKLVVDYNATIVGHHFCQHDKTRTSNAKRMLMSLAAQLSARLGSYKEELFELLQAENTDAKALQQEFLDAKSYNVASLFQLLFLDPLAEVDDPEDNEKPLIFLIDALDEVDSANGKNEFVDCIQLNFHKLPDWLRVFVTTRPESPMAEVHDNNIIGRLKAFNTFLLQPSDQNNAKDLETFYHFFLSEFFPEDSERQAAVRVLMSKTKGSFIYAKYAVEKIIGESNNKLSINSLELFPDGLEDFYEEQLCHRVLGPELSEHGKYKESLEWTAIQLILVAAEPLHTTLLQLLLECSESKAEQVMEHLSTFFLKHSGHLQVYHKSLKDWLTNDEQRHGAKFFVETQNAEGLLGDRCLEILKMVLESLARNLPTAWSMKELTYSQESVCYVLQFTLQHIFRGNASSSITKVQEFLYDENVSYVLARTLLADDFSNLVSDLLQLGKKCKETIFLFGRALQLSQDTIQRKGWQHLPSQLVGRLRGPAAEGGTWTMQQEDPQMRPTPNDLFRLVMQWNSYHYGFHWWSPKVPTWTQADDSCLQAIMAESEVHAVSFSPDGSEIACGLKNGNIVIYSVGDGTFDTLEGHTACVRSVAWSPLDRDLLASGASDATVRIWSCKSGNCKCTLEGHSSWVNSVAWSPLDRDLLASGSSDETVRIWSCNSGKCEGTLEGHTGSVRSVAWSSLDHDLLASGSYDKTVRIWSCISGKCERTLEGHTGWVYSVAWSPLDRNLLASGSCDATVCIWSCKSGNCERTLEGHTDYVLSVTWSPLDRDLLASGSFDKTVCIWSCKSGNCERTLEGHTGSVQSVAWSPMDRDILASGSYDKTVRIWSCKSGNCERTPEGHTDSVESISWSPLDRDLLASGSHDETVRIWSCKSGNCELTLKGHTLSVRSVAWSPLERDLMASGSSDRTVRIWSCKSGKCECTLYGHTNRVMSVAWSPIDRDLLASGSDDKTVRIWSYKSGRCISVLYDQNWQNVDALDWKNIGSTYEQQETAMNSTVRGFEAENEDLTITSSQILPLDGIESFVRQENHAAGVWGRNHVAFFELRGLEDDRNHRDETVSEKTTEGVFSRKKWLSDLLNAAHQVAPSLVLEKSIVNKFRHPPVDVFCIHTGVLKNMATATMVDILTNGGFKCFFEREMSMNQGAPTAQMAMALETCRHAVVVLSKAFLQKEDPCSELCYVFRRMKWLRDDYKGWESVHVVLYDLTVEDYKKEQSSSLRSNLLPALPDLGPDIVMTKWEAGTTWPRLCHELKGDLIEHDNDCAVELWTKFLEEWDADKFPRALDIYKEPANTKQPQAQDPSSK